jgi:predicted PurR-regulated permease PerM
VLRAGLLIALALLAWWVVGDVLLVIFSGVLLAVLLNGLSEWIAARTGLPARLSFAAVVVSIGLAIAAAAYFLMPRTGQELGELATQLPQELQRLEGQIAQTSWGEMLIRELTPGGTGGGAERAALGHFFGAASSAASAAAGLVIALFVGLYLAADPGIYLTGALRLVPPTRRSRARDVLIEVALALRWWFIGRLISMAVIAAATCIGLWLLGVPLALTLGLLSGALSFVPYIGSVSSAVPPLLIALTKSPSLALYVILLYLLVHILEGYVLVPLMQKRLVHLPPALTLSAQAILGSLFGIIGLALATPLTAAALVAVRMLYVEDILHDDLDDLDDPPRSHH